MYLARKDGHADAIGLAGAALRFTERNECAPAGVQAVDPEQGPSGVVPVGGDHQDAPGAEVQEVDIVHPAGRSEVHAFAGEAVDVEPRLLVGADDEALLRIAWITPDGGVVGGVVRHSAHRGGLAAGGY